MKTIVMILVAFVHEIVLSRATLQLENVALRQQVAVLKRERPRPRLHPLDRVFWVLLFHLWPRWKDALVIVKPETVSLPFIPSCLPTTARLSGTDIILSQWIL